MIDNLSSAVHAFNKHILTSLSVDEIMLLRHVNLSTNFIGLTLKVEMASSRLKRISYLRSHRGQCLLLLCRQDSAWSGVFARSARSSA